MKKVVAFLEKYAEWLAMSFACAFLLYMVYAYVVSPDDLRVPLGKEALMPEEVDPHIGAVAADLQKQMEAPSDIAFPVPDFVKGFSLAMSKDRARMSPEFVMGTSFRPSLVGTQGPGPIEDTNKAYVTKLVDLRPIAWTIFNQGNSLVAVAPPAVQGAAAPAVAPPANKVEKNWIMGEGRIEIKALAAAWKESLFDAKGEQPLVPAAALLTHFLKVEVEREELVDVNLDVWTPAVPIAPLLIADIKDYPKEGDREGQEEFRLWAEKHQVEIVEPPFYPVLHGDEWYIPSIKAKEKEATAGADVVKEGPFDPANPPKRPLTPAETQQVYKYNQAQRDAKQKAEAQARKSKLDSTRKPSTPSGGGGEGGGRRIGGYAPLPGEGRPPGQRYDDAGRPIGSGRPTGTTGRPTPGRETPGRLVNPAPMISNGAVQNAALSQPFDPSSLALVDAKGDAASIIVWFHDDTVIPGKTYRYRVKYSLKNPVYHVQGVVKNPAFEERLAVDSPWSEWSGEVKAPSNTEFFFPRAVQPINGKVSSVIIDVFKREKGDWYHGTFNNIGPGDGIGSVKNKMDFTTGMTLVDIRQDVREKDLKILVCDEAGNIRVISFETQKVDPLYTSLKEKAKATAAAGPAADASNR